MYKHWRYRPLAAYPFYANISEDFERRLDEGARHLPPMTSKVKLPMVTLAGCKAKRGSVWCWSTVESFQGTAKDAS